MANPVGPVCPYCDRTSVLYRDSSEFYHGRNYGPLWACKPCGAWVGCHPNTVQPLGRLADAELRRAKRAAHDAFDRLWRAKMERAHVRKHVARSAGYAWLAEQLGMSTKDCHIGMMAKEDCERVVAVCRPYVERL